MFTRIITFSIRNPLIVGLAVLGLIVWGVVSFRDLPIDAVPDITNNQVQIVTLSPALAPSEVERLITIPVEQTMATIDGIVERRSISRFGLSVITLVFEDHVDLYWARAQVDQRLSEATDQIPPSAGTPTMMPITTGLGEIYQYQLIVDSLHARQYTPMDLRTLHDWSIRRRLLGTGGVADVASFGGFLRQVEIAVDPDRLRSMGLSIADVAEQVDRNNGNSGGSYIERGPTVAYIRTEGMATTNADLERIVVGRTDQGLPIRVSDIAVVRDGSAVRYGALTQNSNGETVGGIVYMLKGANSSEVIENVKQRIAQIQETLPEGIAIEPYLDRSDLVQRTIRTVGTNLIEGALIVIFVLVLMLGNVRAGLIVASVIPLSMLFAIGMMRVAGVSGNLMSLGAIDFGLIVDGAVIIVEHVLHRLQRLQPQQMATQRKEHIQGAAIEIRRSAAFGEVIILIVYLPILTLVGIEGKMFGPMAQTVVFAILGAFLLSTTYVPMMSSLFLKKVKPHGSTFADRLIERIYAAYRPIRRFALQKPAILFSGVAAALVASVVAFTTMGAEFIPQLSEGDFAVEVRLPTGSSLEETITVSQQASEVLLRQFPEVQQCVGKIGTTEIPLDPMPLEACDLMVILKPRDAWTTATTREELADAMATALHQALPGVEFGVQQPIQMRFNELMTGARQDVVVKVFGDDLAELARLADSIGVLASAVPGAADIYVEPIDGLPQVVVAVDRAAAATLGVAVYDINSTVQAAFAGQPAGSLYEGERRFDVMVRLHPDDRASIETLQRLYVPTTAGTLVPLHQVSRITMPTGPNQIQREDGRRRIIVGFNVRDRDVQSIVADLQQRVGTQLQMPPGYEITYGGAFENLNAASARLAIAVPAALLLILVLLYITFGSAVETLLVFTAIPLSAIGGIAALLLRGLPFSISAGVGFIALFGVAVLNGIVLMSAFKKHAHSGALRTVLRGTTDRLRPVMMTALVASLGFIPMALSTSDGAEVQRPLATVVIGGLVSSTLLTLVILPALYFVVRTRIVRHTRSAAASVMAALLILGSLGLADVSAQTAPPTPLPRAAVLQLVQQRNITVEQATLRQEQARVLKGASVDLGPTSIVWSGGQYNAPDFDNSFSIEQSVPFPTRLAAAHGQAEAAEAVAAIEKSLAVRSVTATAEGIMDRIAYQRGILRILDQQDTLMQRAAVIAKRSFDAGQSPSVALLTAETNASEATMQRLQAEADLVKAELELRVLCRDSAVTVLDSTLVRQPAYVQGTLAKEFRVAAERRQQLAAEQADYASTEWWPDLTLAYTNQSLIGTPLPTGGAAVSSNRFEFATVGISLPLWFPATSSRIEASQVEQQIIARTEQAELLALDRRVNMLEQEFRALQRAMDHYDGPSATRIATLIDHADRSYNVGDISWSEYQEAMETALDVQRRRLDVLLRYNEVVIELRQLTMN